MSEEHGSLIKTPKQLIAVAVIALLTPVLLAFLGAQLVTGSKRIDTEEEAVSVAQRIQPVGQLHAIEGGAPLADASSAEPAAPAEPKTPEAIYQEVCTVCHGNGIAGAPKTGDQAAWAPRIAKGMSTLYDTSLKGIGAMPPKGGATSLSDDEIKAAVDYLVARAK